MHVFGTQYGVSDGKESAFNVRDLGLIPGSGRSSGEGKWQPTPVFLPGKLLLLLTTKTNYYYFIFCNILWKNFLLNCVMLFSLSSILISLMIVNRLYFLE